MHPIANASISDGPNVHFYSSVCGCNAVECLVKRPLIKLNMTLSVCMWASLTPFLCLAAQQAVFAGACTRLCVLDGLSRKGNTTQ